MPDGPTCRISLPDSRQTAQAIRFCIRPANSGSHEIWFNPVTNRYTTIPNHPGDIPEDTLRAILKQCGIDTDQFLSQ